MPTMNFERTFTDYFLTNFLEACYETYSHFATFNASLITCQNIGTSMGGMPSIELLLEEDRSWNFNSSTYFMYPSYNYDTTPVNNFVGFVIL
jgi:hypothetical protein